MLTQSETAPMVQKLVLLPTAPKTNASAKAPRRRRARAAPGSVPSAKQCSACCRPRPRRRSPACGCGRRRRRRRRGPPRPAGSRTPSSPDPRRAPAPAARSRALDRSHQRAAHLDAAALDRRLGRQVRHRLERAQVLRPASPDSPSSRPRWRRRRCVSAPSTSAQPSASGQQDRVARRHVGHRDARLHARDRARRSSGP